MNKVLFSCIFSMLFICLNALGYSEYHQQQLAPSANNFLGEWQNSKGTTLVINGASGHHISGFYLTPMARTESCINFPIPFEGVTNGNTFSISTTMANCGSKATVSISGHLSKSQKKLNSITVVQVADEDDNFNRDSTMVFRRVFGLVANP